MQVHRMEVEISNNRSLMIKELLFHPGDKVDVIIRSRTVNRESSERYPLRGKPVRDIDPFDSVAENDWDVLK